MLNKRGQGLSLNVIVIAAIVLIVMVVLIMVFTGKIGNWTNQTNTCEAQGGTCGTDCSGSLSKTLAGTCAVDTDVCCLQIGAASDDSA